MPSPLHYADYMAWTQDAGVLFESAWLLARMPWEYQEDALPAFLARLGAGAPRDGKRGSDFERVGRLTATAASRLPLARRFGLCLKRALIRYALLRRRGLPVTFHLGLRQSDGRLEGHAWLSLHGAPLWERGGVEGYRETFRYPNDS